MRKIPFITDSRIYKPSEIKTVLDTSVNAGNLIGNNKGVYYFNVPCAFDIETSSFYRDNGVVVDYKQKREIQETINPDYNPEKIAIMYVWQFGINGRVIMGRTWDEFWEMLDFISTYLHLDEKRRLCIYVHNLAFEFQFMYKWVNWEKVFSIDNRKPIYAVTDKYIEFRCSLLLSGYSLANLGKQLQRYKVQKLVGDLDYSLLRHSETPLTEKEIAYCVNDVRVVMAYIQEKIENENGIVNIPITKTGYVRNYCRKNTLYLPNSHKRNMNYRRTIKQLVINDMAEFDTMQRAFQGGFTHANARYSGATVENVASYDFTSSYPYVMVSEKYPMSRGVKIELHNKKEFDFYLTNYLTIFDIELVGLTPQLPHENYISVSKCTIKENVTTNNGRVVYADRIKTTITGVDYGIIKRYYHWKDMFITNFYVYHAQYLPTPLVNCILDLYEKKTTLKGVEGKEVEYLQSKEMINSVYGMSVTNPLRDEYTLDELNEWIVNIPNAPEKLSMLQAHNESNNRFLFYIWGVFVTAYARRNLFSAITELENDYIYSDTDSVKVINYEKHKEYFDIYDSIVIKKLKAAAEYHNIDFAKFSPQTIEGKTKTLGLWDFEGVYSHFKTLGAKRYLVAKFDENGQPHAINIDGVYYPVSITVAGLNKYVAIPYLFDELAKGDIGRMFNNFNEGLRIPPEKTGKMLHTYIDDEKTGVVVDYTGKSCAFYEKSAVHLENTGYDLTIAKLYADYIKGLKSENGGY